MLWEEFESWHTCNQASVVSQGFRSATLWTIHFYTAHLLYLVYMQVELNDDFVSSTFLCSVDSKVAFVSTEVGLDWPEPLFCEVSNNGLLSLSGVWKGLIARIIMIGTLTALQWFIYDSVKVYFRLPRPPPPEMPESLKKKLGLTE